MAFCVNCGTQLPDTGRFCVNCGAPISGGTPAGGPPAIHQPLDYTIQGDNLQVIRIRLQPGQELYAEAGKMVYKQPQVETNFAARCRSSTILRSCASGSLRR